LSTCRRAMRSAVAVGPLTVVLVSFVLVTGGSLVGAGAPQRSSRPALDTRPRIS
jgi:hypothetical protein